MTGKTIAHYEITGKLGEGGMGVVYRARDTKLGRDVALKVLPEQFARDQQRMARFEREARVLASLNHPHIASIYGLAESNGVRALVMELVEGPTLAGRIADGPIPLEEALPLARQMAEALEYAHDKGVIHRDLKPANVKLTAEGNIKVLDFGLAKAVDATAASGDPFTSPTLTMEATRAGVILGTAGYMSPEQARGEAADKRADIWSFGAVLYEMLTGRQLFQAETVSDSLAAVLTRDPNWEQLPARTPAGVRRLLRRCLDRDRKKRLRDIGEARIAIEEHLADPTGAPVLVEAATIAPEPARQRLPWVLFAVATSVALIIAFVDFGKSPPESPLRRFAFSPLVAGERVRLRDGVAISPNGKHIAYTTAGAEVKLWVQDLDQSQPRVFEGTDGARLPFWSPDSDFIGFATAGELKKVSVEGGLAIRLCPLPAAIFAGGSWSADGEVIAVSSGSYEIYVVPARGGAAKLLIAREESTSSSVGPTGYVARPHFLPAEAGGRVLVYTFGLDERTMMVQDLDSGRRGTLGPGNSPYYSRSGHLLYHLEADNIHDLWALPFSLETLEATGEPFPIAQNGHGPTVAADQTLVYLDGSNSQEQLVWLDRGGQKIGEIGQAQDGIGDPALSPDGKLVAFVGREGPNTDVWIWDVTRGVKTRLSSAVAIDRLPVWSPAGAELAISSSRSGNFDIFLRQADGSGEAEALTATPHDEYVTDWSRDGKYLFYVLADPDTGYDSWYLERTEDGGDWEPHPLLQTPFHDGGAKLSPDGRFVAFHSDESGRDEIYARPFPEGGGRVTVSSNGGTQARWSRNGDELFYVEGSTLVAVSVSTSPSFSVGSVTRLFEHPGLSSGNYPHQYDVSADGQRFILAEPVGGDASELSIRIVENWFEEFRDRGAAK